MAKLINGDEFSKRILEMYLNANQKPDNSWLDDNFYFPTAKHEKFHIWEMEKVDDYIFDLEEQLDKIDSGGK